MNEAREFGATLRRERERHGITLDGIAEQTKVAASLLAGLERGDLSRWPAGIFRRAFVRSYAAAVGLDVEETLVEFLRIFPDDGSVRRASTSAGGLRLTLADAGPRWLESRRLAGIATDLSLAVVAGAAGWTAQALPGLVASVAVVVPLYHATGAMLWGMSPGMRLWSRAATVPPRSVVVAPPPAAVAEPAEPVRPAMPEPELEPEIVMSTHVHESARATVLSMASSPRHRTSRRDRRVTKRTERDRDARPSSRH